MDIDSLWLGGEQQGGWRGHRVTRAGPCKAGLCRLWEAWGAFFNILQPNPHIPPISQSEGIAPLPFEIIFSPKYESSDLVVSVIVEIRFLKASCTFKVAYKVFSLDIIKIICFSKKFPNRNNLCLNHLDSYETAIFINPVEKADIDIPESDKMEKKEQKELFDMCP